MEAHLKQRTGIMAYYKIPFYQIGRTAAKGDSLSTWQEFLSVSINPSQSQIASAINLNGVI